MKCPQCHHEQVSGKFCAVCGSPMHEADSPGTSEQAAAASTSTSTVGSNSGASNSESVERVKKISGDYG